ncbi:MAG TPA: hypothetical protein DCM49_06215 [Lachnospiraceae bacterium]|nr:hypothetical protein [Lachnospiraceae bacterium]
MELITEEMVLEYIKCELYSDFMKNYQTAVRNLDDQFFDSVRCHTFYVQKPWEVAQEYRQKARTKKLDPAWIDKYIPPALADGNNY